MKIEICERLFHFIKKWQNFIFKKLKKDYVNADEVELAIFDPMENKFRTLISLNYTDDVHFGLLFLTIDALDILKKHSIICGCVFYYNGKFYPIDIHDSEIVILESTYNDLSSNLKRELVNYNMHYCPEKTWSHLFLEWQNFNDIDFEDKDPFIAVCNTILNNVILLNNLIVNNISIIVPTNYDELCVFTQNIQKIFDVELYDSKYIESLNYIIDGLLNGYHMNMSDFERLTYFYQVCKIVLEKSGGKNV